ncbi:hypothetical protein AAHH78_41300, partial [Burkholderia pseudomallei]
VEVVQLRVVEVLVVVVLGISEIGVDRLVRVVVVGRWRGRLVGHVVYVGGDGPRGLLYRVLSV